MQCQRQRLAIELQWPLQRTLAVNRYLQRPLQTRATHDLNTQRHAVDAFIGRQRRTLAGVVTPHHPVLEVPVQGYRLCRRGLGSAGQGQQGEKGCVQRCAHDEVRFR
ncbi:hypothetical protein D3C79_920170 [compost metagenome]